MRLKKTLAIIMGAALSVASLSGCSQTTLNYASELEKTSKWESTSSEMTGKISIDAQGTKEDINFTSTAYGSGDKGYAKVNFTTDNNELNFNMPNIEVYVDNGISYINKSYYEDMYTNNGIDIPSGLKDLNADYIALDSGVDMVSIEAMANEPEVLTNLLKSIFGDSDIDLPYVQNGREYTINLNSNDAVDLGVKGIKAIANNLENVNNTFKLGFTSDDITQIKAMVSDQYFTNGISGLKETIAGSTISSKELFSDDDYSIDFGMNLIVKDFGNISLSINGTTTKSEAKDIVLPDNAVKLTQEEFQAILGGNDQKQVNSQISYGKEELGLKNFIVNPAA